MHQRKGIDRLALFCGYSLPVDGPQAPSFVCPKPLQKWRQRKFNFPLILGLILELRYQEQIVITSKHCIINRANLLHHEHLTMQVLLH